MGINKPLKFDQKKPRWDLLPIVEVEQIVDVLTMGAKKYNDDNWKLVVKKNPYRYYAACLRHIVAWKKGLRIDPESKKSPLAHAACCLLFLMYNDRGGVNEIYNTIERYNKAHKKI